MTNDPNDASSVVLVDPDGLEIGTAEKLAAHAPPGSLHRAFSVVLVNERGELLLQRRAPTKYHFPGFWANSCCGHPRPGEAPADAVRRRVREELGIGVEGLRSVATFTYRAECPASGLVEHEHDRVFTAALGEGIVSPDPDEIADIAWITSTDLSTDLGVRFGSIAPWLPTVLAVWESDTKRVAT